VFVERLWRSPPGSLTLADDPLIDAQILFKQPRPAHTTRAWPREFDCWRGSAPAGAEILIAPTVRLRVQPGRESNSRDNRAPRITTRSVDPQCFAMKLNLMSILPRNLLRLFLRWPVSASRFLSRVLSCFGSEK
jgi:hypothetical protein